ncbi:MAG: hypothetical protein WA047_20160 [Phenylobacterium sp.]|uniref:hypothetical protein n=1 Tax=Phenylobacterium sp. TaxID=1871053 RepID=UPI003BB5DAF0
MPSLSKIPHLFWPPLLLLMLAVPIALAAVFVAKRETRALLAPMDLRPGFARTLEFKAAYDERYEIGLEMDQQVARRLFPCVIDPLAGSRSGCAGKDMPVELSLSLMSGETELWREVYSAKGVRGGRYGGRETYTLIFDYVRLARGRDYKITVQSLHDGSSLASAHPHLVVDVDALAKKSEDGMRSLAMLAAVALALIGALWMSIVFAWRAWSGRRRAKLSST